MLASAVIVQDYCTWLFWPFLCLNAKGITETSKHSKFHANPVQLSSSFTAYFLWFSLNLAAQKIIYVLNYTLPSSMTLIALLLKPVVLRNLIGGRCSSSMTLRWFQCQFSKILSTKEYGNMMILDLESKQLSIISGTEEVFLLQNDAYFERILNSWLSWRINQFVMAYIKN